MSKLLKIISILCLVFLLVVGCQMANKIEEVREKEITGPSWDVDFAIPLLPERKINVGEKIAENLGEELDLEEGLLLKDEIIILEEVKLMDELDFNLSEEELDFNESINLDEEYDLEQIDNIISQLSDSFSDYEETINVGDNIADAFNAEFNLSLDEVNLDTGISFQENIDLGLTNYNIGETIDEISNEFVIDDVNISLSEYKDDIDIDFSFTDITFGDNDLDIPTEEKDKIENAFDDLVPNINIPDIGEGVDNVIDELKDGQQITDIPFYHPSLPFDNEDIDEVTQNQIDLPSYNLGAEVESVFLAGQLIMTVTNDSNTTITEMTVSINDMDDEILIADSLNGDEISENASHQFTLELDQEELPNEFYLTISGVSTADAPNDPENTIDINISSEEIALVKAVSVNELEIDTQPQLLPAGVKEVEFSSGKLEIAVEVFDGEGYEPENNISDEYSDFIAGIEIKIGNVEGADFVFKPNEDNLLADKILDFSQDIAIEFTQGTNVYIPGAEVVVNIALSNDYALRKVVLTEAESIVIDQKLDLSEQDINVKTVEFASGTLEVDYEVTVNGEDITDELGLNLEDNLYIYFGTGEENKLSPGESLEDKILDFTDEDQIKIFYTNDLDTFFVGAEINIKSIELIDPVIKEAELDETAAITLDYQLSDLIDPIKLPSLPADVNKVKLTGGTLVIAIDDDDLGINYDLADIEITIGETTLTDVTEDGDLILYDLTNLEIEGEESLDISFKASGTKYRSDAVIRIDAYIDQNDPITLGEIDIQPFTQSISHTQIVELPADLKGKITELTFESGQLDIEIIDQGLDLNLQFNSFNINGKSFLPVNFNTEESRYEFDFSNKTINVDYNEDNDIKLEIAAEVEVGSFTYVENVDEITINVSINDAKPLDWENVKIVDYQIEGLSLFDEFDFDFEEITGIQFAEGSKMEITLEFDPDLADYTFAIDIDSEEFATIIIDQTDGGFKEYDLEDKIIDFTESMDITFSGTYVKGTDITAKVELDISEIIFLGEESLSITQTVPLPDFDIPDELKSATLTGGLVEVSIDTSGLGIEIEELYLKLGKDELSFDYISEAGDVLTYQLNLADFEISSDSGEGDSEIYFQVAVNSYKPSEDPNMEVTVNVDIIEDISIGRIELKADAFSFSVEEDLAEIADMLSYLHSIVFRSGQLAFNIDDGGLDILFKLDVNLFKQEIISEEFSEEFSFDFSDLNISFADIEEEAKISIDFQVLAFTYQEKEDRGSISVTGNLTDLDWEEINIASVKIEEEIEKELPINEIIDIGLDEVPEELRGIKFNEHIINKLNLIIDNKTSLGIKIEDIVIAALDQEENPILDENQEEVKETLSFELPAREGEDYSHALINKEIILQVLSIIEAYPAKIKISGGNFSFTSADEGYISIKNEENMSFAVRAEYEIALGLKIESEEENFTFQLDPILVELSQEEKDDISKAINEIVSPEQAILYYELSNRLPLAPIVTLYLGEYDEEDEENGLENFYANADKVQLIKLPQAVLNDAGFAIAASPKELNQLVLEKSLLEKIIDDDLYVGLELEIPLEEHGNIALSIEDYITMKMWAAFKLRINPQEGGK